ncbi:dual specificity phosphatase catalytic domain-containing protein [Lichtheimia corymbifera JMRC:FSU:9682]|uniref:Dual specificity phosphatase catalytic domain-containing protein n=1 Tax=Lichtheimia corymbifera JMRC:FSU:9682 TaxID=1263082 RepID=A0A068RJL3_9FUNG|nr:dual specificity phosphatase catalytic domain-containing protein [Lichtheimia corymbifera JMRC:FSU:9682]
MFKSQDTTSNTTIAASIIASILGLLYLRRKLIAMPLSDDEKLERDLLNESESSLLANHSQHVQVRGHKLRVVYIPCTKPEAPLILFIHGLGGQASQWETQLDFFAKRDTANLLAVDMLGCGKSEVSKEWDAYRTQSLAEDVIAVLHKYAKEDDKQQIMVVGHSYGCAVATYVAASSISNIATLVLIAPKAQLDAKQQKGKQWIRYIPDWLFDRGRRADRRGGLYSKSVNRFLNPDQEIDDGIRRKQLFWNLSSRTPVYKRYVYGVQLPTSDVYKRITAKQVKLIGGSMDTMVPPSDMEIINRALDDHHQDLPLLVQGAGHMPMVTHANQINMTLTTLGHPYFSC